MKENTILIVDDEPDIRNLLQEILEDEGFSVRVASSASDGRKQVAEAPPGLILLDIWMPGMDGITLLREWHSHDQLPCPIVVMSGHGTVETAVEATRLGAYDYIEKPLSTAKLLLTVRHALEAASLQNENVDLKRRHQVQDFPTGKSHCMIELQERIKRVASHDTPVLFIGEPGSYKELYARHLHALSKRSDQPFITAADASAGNPPSVERLTDLVSRTGAGTLFLKYPADLTLEVQGALLNMLEGQGYGQQQHCHLTVATRQPLETQVRDGHFRDDLFFLLNVAPVRVPPLRERQEDIPQLLEFYVNLSVEQDGLPYRHFGVAAQNRLHGYHWPGNLRELRNLVQRLLIMGGPETIEVAEIERCLLQDDVMPDDRRQALFHMPLRDAREKFEKDYLEYQLKRYHNNVSKMATVIGIERTHLYRKMKLLGIKVKH